MACILSQTQGDIMEPTPKSSIISRVDLSASQSYSLPTPPTSNHILEPDASDSLQWDPLGTELLSLSDPSYLEDLYDIPLDRVQNLQYVLPLPRLSTTPPPVQRSLPNLLEVAYLDLKLPITSTPKPHRPRVSNPRQSLPLETPRYQNFLPAFIRRLLPFKKKE